MIRLISLLLLLSLTTIPCDLRAAQIIVHRSVVQTELTLNVARLLFTMRLLRWPDSTRVRVFVLPDSDPLHREFSKQTLDLYPRQLRRVWDRHLFSGAGAVPVQVGTIEEMIRLVAETPGAVGYAPNGLATEKVRILNVK